MRSILARVVASLVVALSAVAGEPAGKGSVSNESAEQPRAEDTKKALSSENRSIDGLEIEVRPDGILKVDLRGRFQHALAVRIEPDGSSVVECIDTAEMMAAFIAGVAEESARRTHETAEK